MQAIIKILDNAKCIKMIAKQKSKLSYEEFSNTLISSHMDQRVAISTLKGFPSFDKVFECLCDLYLIQTIQTNALLNTHICVDMKGQLTR